VIATGLAIGSALLARKQIEVSRQRDRANELAGIADAQRDRAEQNARLARRAVDEMFTQVAEKWLADQPRLEPVQREFLEKALRFYEEFSSQKETDPTARKSVADAWRRVGEIRLKLGMIRPAEEAFRRALAIDLALAEVSPNDPELRYRTTKPYLALARLLLADDKPKDATDAYRQVEQIARTLTDGMKGPVHYRAALSDALGGLGLIHFRLRRLPEAEQALGKAVSIREGLLRDSQDPKYRSTLANDVNNLAATLAQAGRLSEAKAVCRRAMESRQRLLDQSPESKECQDELAMSIANLGSCCYALKEFAEAEVLCRRALPIRRKLAADFPRVPDYRHRLAGDLDNLAVVLRNTGRPVEAEPFRREAIAVLESLVRDHPGHSEYRAALGERLSNLGVLLKDVGKAAEAEAAFRRAMETLEPMIAEHPEVPPRFIRFLECARARGGILHDLGRNSEAEAVFRRTIDVTDRVATRLPKVPVYTQQRIRLLTDFTRFLIAVHRDGEARESLLRAVALTEGFPDAGTQNTLAWILATSPDARLRDPRTAVRLAKMAVERQPSAAGYWNTLGVAYDRSGDPEPAIEALEKSIKLGAGGSPADWLVLAMAHWKLGHKDQARKWYTRATDRMGKEESRDEELLRFRAEAAALLGVSDPPKLSGEQEGGTARPLKP
jgi:tetratricopeptide (TPR) repeat protein